MKLTSFFALATCSSLISMHGFSSNVMLEETTITPPASYVTKEGADVILDAAFIYWTAREDGLQAAYTSVPVLGASPASNSTLPQGSFQYPNWSFDPGFKAGLGLAFKHDGWDLYTAYTHLNTSVEGSQNYQSNPGTTLLSGAFSIFSYPLFTNLQTAKTTWSLHFNNLDLELGRDYYISHLLTIRPHFGFKGSWQKQQFNGYYTHTPTSNPNLPIIGNASDVFHSSQNFWGFGLRTGFDSAWTFATYWSVFGDLALSALWCQFQSTTNVIESASLAQAGITVIDYSNVELFNNSKSFHSIKAVLELALGIRFDYLFSDDHYRFRVQAGWEQQVWFNQNQFLPFSQLLLTQQGDLTLQGLTLKFRFDF